MIRAKALTKLGAVAMLLVGALIGALTPRVVERIWPPDKNVPGVAIVGYQNSHNGTTYFPREPDWDALRRAYAKCQDIDPTESLLRSLTTEQRCPDYGEFGGIPEFGGAFVDITNQQPNSIQITEVRAVVDRRARMAFAVKYRPPIGGDIGTSLAFNLDRTSSRAVRVQTRSDLGLVTAAGKSTPYFSSKHFEIEANRTESFFTVPVAKFEGVIEWHLEITYEATDEDGNRARMLAMVRPPGGNFKGVPAHVKAGKVLAELPV
jgi:hypothetical protein